MRRKTFFWLAFGLFGFGIVAIVRAQAVDGKHVKVTEWEKADVQQTRWSADGKVIQAAATEEEPTPARGFGSASPTRRPSRLQQRLQSIRNEPLRTSPPTEPQPITEVESGIVPSSGTSVLRSVVQPAEQPNEPRTLGPTPADPNPSSRRRPRPIAPPTTPSVPSTHSVQDTPQTSRPIRNNAPRAIESEGQVYKLKPATRMELDGVLATSKGPVLGVATMGPKTIVIGKEALYAVTIANGGEAIAENVEVLINIPGSADVSGTEPTNGRVTLETTEGGEGRLRWTITRLDRRSKANLAIRLIATDSQPFNFGVTWTHAPAAAVARVEVKQPKLALSLSGPSEILYGENKLFTITISNPGDGDAENVIVNLLPIVEGQQIAGIRKIPVLKAGESKQFQIELAAQHAGQLQIQTQAFGDFNLRAEAAQDVLVRRGHLEISLVAPESKYAGTVTSYQIRLANNGDATSDKVVLMAALPKQAKFVDATQGGEFDAARGAVIWKVGSVRPDVIRDFEFNCVLGEAGPNRLEVSANGTGDLSVLQSAVTLVEAIADLKLVVNDPQGPVPVGEDTEYEIQIINRGTKAAESVSVYAYFSEGIEPLQVSGARAELDQGQVVFQPVTRIAAGEKLTLTITALAETSGNHVFRAEVECKAPETKLATEETTRFYGKPRTTAGTPTPADAEIRR